MIDTMTEQNTKQSFFEKYKKWIVAIIGIHLIPSILLMSTFIGFGVYFYANDDTNFHPYKSYIVSGFESGFKDGSKDHVIFSKNVPSTLWNSYYYDTDKLKEKVALEKAEYLLQFPESERGSKLAEMKLNNIKLPLQLKLDNRFTSGLDFYADHVKKRVNRADHPSGEAYNKVLEKEAWKVGYAHGYNKGLQGRSYTTARNSLDY